MYMHIKTLYQNENVYYRASKLTFAVNKIQFFLHTQHNYKKYKMKKKERQLYTAYTLYKLSYLPFICHYLWNLTN